MRKITSLTILLSFVVLIINSLVLYVVPEGRVAYWADWRWLGLTKSQWAEQHTVLGFLFLAACILHLFYNWKPIISYMKNQSRQFKLFTLPFNVSALIVTICIVGTYYQVPPMSTIDDISAAFKESASETYGNPPYGHAELSSLKMLCQKEGLNLNQAKELLQKADIDFTNEQETILSIAKKNDKTPQQIWLIIKNGLGKQANQHSFPDSPKEGWGKLTLESICTSYNLNITKILKELQSQGIEATAEQQIKTIAGNNEVNSMQLFEILHNLATHN